MSTWRFLVDENQSPTVATKLSAAGHDAVHVRDHDRLSLGDADRADILPVVRTEGRIVVTNDTDFVAMDVTAHSGVVVLYDDAHSTGAIVRALLALIADYESPDALVVAVLDDYF